MVKKNEQPAILSSIRRVVINMLSLDNTEPSFTKKQLSKRKRRKFVNWDEAITRIILGTKPLRLSRAKILVVLPTASGKSKQCFKINPKER